jgi:hypothetical protein
VLSLMSGCASLPSAPHAATMPVLATWSPGLAARRRSWIPCWPPAVGCGRARAQLPTTARRRENDHAAIGGLAPSSTCYGPRPCPPCSVTPPTSSSSSTHPPDEPLVRLSLTDDVIRFFMSPRSLSARLGVSLSRCGASGPSLLARPATGSRHRTQTARGRHTASRTIKVAPGANTSA